MPRLSVWALRLGLLYFAAGITIGALLLVGKAMPIPPAWWALLPLHIEFLLPGWTLLLIIGVTYWILPRLSGSDRGNIPLAWVSFFALNAGVALVTAGYLFRLPLLLAAGRASEFLAVLLYSLTIWARIRPTYPS